VKDKTSACSVRNDGFACFAVEVAEHGIGEESVSAGLVALTLAGQPGDYVGVEPESKLLFAGAIEGMGAAFRQNFSVSGGMSEKSIVLSG
jgi:hypothetical protein